MGMANIDALVAEIAGIKESLRIKQQSLANINPNLQMNAVYIAKLKAEVAALNVDLSNAEASLKSASTPAKVSPSRADTGTSVQSTPYDDDGNLNQGWEINQETGEPYYTGNFVYKETPIKNDPTDHGTPYDDEGNLNNGWGLDENGDPVWVGAGYNDATGTVIQPIKDEPTSHGTPYDDEGNLMPGWSLDENGDPVWVGGGFVESATQASAAASRADAKAAANSAAVAAAAKAALPDPPKDWRVRISLAKGSDYLYNAGSATSRDAGILEPLRGTGGVVFPYTPTIVVGYTAQYHSESLTHSNYKIHNYSGSSIENVTVTGDFTAQDVNEANYMLAVIHFFRSATKMFYGKDLSPSRGVPPPLLYLSGFGQYQFDNHPMVLTNFTYTTPIDVDYLNAYPNGADTTVNGVSLAPFQKQNTAKPTDLLSRVQRLFGAGLSAGGTSKPPVFVNAPSGNNNVTRVPTKISISLTFLPIVTRKAISNEFSLKKYATGQLLRGSQNPGTGGGIW